MIAQLDSTYVKTRPSKAIVRVLSHLFFQGRFLTTPHRWLNRFILAELACLKRLPRLKSVQQPIFIVGTGRSGSTILGKVLSMHRDVGFLNEPKAMWYALCPQEDVNGHFSKGPAFYRLAPQDATPPVREGAHRVFGAYLALTCSRRVLDKNPEMVFRIPFIQAIFPDAKFLFLVRNGWDTVSSIVAWSKRRGMQTREGLEDWWGLDQRKWHLMIEQLVPTEPLLCSTFKEIDAYTQHKDMAAVEWVLTMQEGLRAMVSQPDSIHLVRFEDLTQRPKEVLQETLSFCGLPQDDVFMSYAQQALKPVSPRKRWALPSAVEPAFLGAMQALDYDVS